MINKFIDDICQACSNMKSQKYDYFITGFLISIIITAYMGPYISLIFILLINLYLKDKENKRDKENFYAALYMRGNVDTDIDSRVWWQDWVSVYDNTFSNKKIREKAKKHAVMIMNGNCKKLSLKDKQLAAFYKVKDHITEDSLHSWWDHFRPVYDETFLENEELAKASQERANEIFSKGL